MGCHPRGTRGRPRSHAGRGGASRPVTGRVGVRPSLTCITRPCRARYSWPMHLRAYAQLLGVPSSAPVPSVGSRRPVACSHPRWGNFPTFACEGAGAAPIHRLRARRARRWGFLDQRWTPAKYGRHRRRAREGAPISATDTIGPSRCCFLNRYIFGAFLHLRLKPPLFVITSHSSRQQHLRWQQLLRRAASRRCCARARGLHARC